MRRPPRSPAEPLLSGFLVWRVGFVSLLLIAASLCLHGWAHTLGLDEAAARTVAVNTLVAGQAGYLFNCRYLLDPVLNWRGLTGNRYVLGAIILLALQQLAFTYWRPMNALFGTTPLPAEVWAPIIGVGLAVLLVVEAEKALLSRYRAARQ